VFHHQVDVDVADALALLGDDRDFQTVGIGDVRGLTEIRRDDDALRYKGPVDDGTAVL
jgi:hypothetical protein